MNLNINENKIKWEGLKTSSFLNFCENKKLSVSINENFISIKSGIADWLIHFDKKGNTLKLLHRNLYKTSCDFHLQKEYKNVNENTLREIAFYIYKHDNYKSSNKQFKKRSSIDRLFLKIEKQKG